MSALARLALCLAFLAVAPARAERLEKCPVDAGDAEATTQAVRDAPSCAQAYEVMNVCRKGEKSDVALAQIVVEHCEEVLNPTLDEPRFRAYANARASCAKRFSQDKSERALSYQAVCEAGVAVVFAQRADVEAIRARRDRAREGAMPRPPGQEPRFEQEYPQALPPVPPPPADPFGALPEKR